MSFKLEQTAAGINLALTPDTLSVENHEGGYYATFQSGINTVRLKLNKDLLSILGLQCVAHMPEIAPDRQVHALEDSYRLPAQFIKSLDNRSLQCLIRECSSETLVRFLWYMKDGDLIRQTLRNMSQRAAAMLMDDLEQNWHGRIPDDATSAYTQQGRESVLRIVGLARRLADEGWIEVPESSLTTEEIDALLSGVTK